MDEQDTSSNEASRKGLGGALSVLIFLLIAGTLYRFTKGFADIGVVEADTIGLSASAEWQSYKTKVTCLAALDFAVSIFAAVRLIWFRNPVTVPIVIACLWFLGPIQIGLAKLLAPTGEDVTFPAIVSCIIPAIWTAYLLLSQRVKNTYRDNELL